MGIISPSWMSDNNCISWLKLIHKLCVVALDSGATRTYSSYSCFDGNLILSRRSFLGRSLWTSILGLSFWSLPTLIFFMLNRIESKIKVYTRCLISESKSIILVQLVIIRNVLLATGFHRSTPSLKRQLTTDYLLKARWRHGNDWILKLGDV